MSLAGLKSLAKTVSRAQSGGGSIEEEFLSLFKGKVEVFGRQSDMERARYEYESVPYAIHPSNIGSCGRCIFYNYLKYEPEPGSSADETLVSIQDSGTDRHERFQSYLYKMGPQIEFLDPRTEAGRAREKGINTFIVVEPHNIGKVFGKDYYEIRCYNTDFPTWFKTDGIFRFKGYKGIFEFKTEIEQKNMARIAPEPTHLEQAYSYALAFDLDYILFVYEDRNLFRKKIYFVKVDPDKKQQLLEKYGYIRLHADMNELPPAEKEKCKKSYCKHCNKCKMDFKDDEHWERYIQFKNEGVKLWVPNAHGEIEVKQKAVE
jgi:hypothetical protein